MQGENRIMINNVKQYQLSVCIPNYNRIELLERLLENVSSQITESNLGDEVEICVSDDCSKIDPVGIIEKIKTRFPEVSLVYTRNRENMGMDYNFLNSVSVAHGKYAWIVGNDDIPVEDALSSILKILGMGEYWDIDIMVSPFDIFSYNNDFIGTGYPLGSAVQEDRLFDTGQEGQLHQFIMTVEDNSAVFGFLSNVIFKRSRWIQHGNMFADKMSSIFIQVYMNLQTMKEGAKYLYTPQKIIRNYIDDETNQTLDRIYRIAVGLYDAMDYFFSGEERAYIEKQVVDLFMASVFMEFPETDIRKKKVDGFISEKMDIFRKYYVRQEMRPSHFRDKTVIIYGAGCFGRKALEDLRQYEVDLIGFCDADVHKQGDCIEGKLVFDFERLLHEYGRNNKCEIIVANNRHLVPIVQNLLHHQVFRIAVIT